jgi:5-formyltetrahydrofolate cyclo-ligase
MLGSVNSSKNQLRPILRQRWREMTPTARAAASAAITARLRGVPQFAAARVVFAYVSMPAELDTHALIQSLLAAGVTVLTPALDHGVMQARVLRRWIDLTPDALGILTPPPPEAPGEVPWHDTTAPAIDAALIPGLAFTARGERLGRGGGHYDRWLATHPVKCSIALTPDEMLVDCLPVEPHDRRVDLIVTPTRVLRCA